MRDKHVNELRAVTRSGQVSRTRRSQSNVPRVPSEEQVAVWKSSLSLLPASSGMADYGFLCCHWLVNDSVCVWRWRGVRTRDRVEMGRKEAGGRGGVSGVLTTPHARKEEGVSVQPAEMGLPDSMSVRRQPGPNFQFSEPTS